MLALHVYKFSHLMQTQVYIHINHINFFKFLIMHFHTMNLLRILIIKNKTKTLKIQGALEVGKRLISSPSLTITAVQAAKIKECFDQLCEFDRKPKTKNLNEVGLLEPKKPCLDNPDSVSRVVLICRIPSEESRSRSHLHPIV